MRCDVIQISYQITTKKSTLRKVLDTVTSVFMEVNAVIITVLGSPNSAAWTDGDVTTG